MGPHFAVVNRNICAVESYIRCGIPEQKVHVRPLGVNESIYFPATAPKKLDLIPATFRFLFVGGTIIRKGIDTLLHCRK